MTQLFALLALRREAISREWATSQLWGDYEAGDLPGVASRLRKELKKAGLEKVELPRKGPLMLPLPAETKIDCQVAMRQVRTVKRGSEEGELETAWETIRSALSALSLPFLDGCNETPFLTEHRRQFEELRYQAQLEACKLAIRLKDHARRVEARLDGEAAVRMYPAMEESYLPLVQLLIEEGEFEDAIAVCEQCEAACGPGSESISRLRAEVARRKSHRGNNSPPLVLSVSDADEDAPFVGREKLLDELSSALAVVEGGGFAGRALSGDKGVGKSRLARQFGRRAHTNGVTVISAGAAQGANRGDDPCQPLIAAIRAWMQRVDPIAVQSFSSEALAEIGRFAPDLVAGLRLPQPVDGPGADRRLRRAIVSIVRNIAEIGPTVLLIDDVHDADQESQRCLEELCSAQPQGLMLVVTTPSGERVELPVRQHIVPLLGESDAMELAEATLDDPDTEAIADLVHRGAGNPFLIIHRTELERIETDFVKTQLDEAGPESHEVFRLAALLGSRFQLVVLRDTAGADAVNRALRAAERSHLVAPTPQAGVLEFTHSLTREALLNGLTSVERSDLSSRLIAALGSDADETAGTRLGLLKGISSANPDEVAAVALQAGQHALDRRNFHSAAQHFLDGLEGEGGDPGVTGRLLMGLARAYWSLGEFKLARTQFLRAVRLSDIPPDLRAEAALGFGGRLGFGGAITDRQYISVLRSALDNLPEEYSALRLRLQAALAGALTFAAQTPSERQRMQELAEVALAGAKKIDDKTVAAEVLSDICWTSWDPHDGEKRRDVARMFVDFAEQSRDIGLLLEARIFRLASALADGEMDLVHQDSDDCAGLAEQAGIPHYEALAALLSAMHALLSGALDRAEHYSRLALDLGKAGQNPVIFELYGAQVLLIRLFEGRVDKIRASAEALAGAFPRMPAWKAGLGLILADLGRTEDAKRQLDLVARDDFASVPNDLFWMVTLDHAARLAARLGDRERCESLYEKLLPFAGEIVVAGAAVAVYGAIDRALGLLAAARGDHQQAIDHLRDAQQINQRIGVTAVNAYVTAELAEVLAASGSEEAAALARRAQRLADEMGLQIGPRPEAKNYADPAHPPGAIGVLKQGGANRVSQFLRGRIEGKSDHWMQQWVLGTRALRRTMPLAFLPAAACGWAGEIEIEFQPPIGIRSGEGHWTFAIDREGVRIRPEASWRADVKMSMSPPTFFKLMAGVLNPVDAWLEELVTIDGDPTVAARLVEMFSGPAPELEAGL